MLVPRAADAFRATVSALRSFDESKGVSFHTFSIPEDRFVRLLVKKLGRQMPEDVVREELENLHLHLTRLVSSVHENLREEVNRRGFPPCG